MKTLTIILFLCLVSLQVGCQTEQATADTSDNKLQAQNDISDEEIEELFLESGLGEGDGNLAKLMKLPRERVIAVVKKIKAESDEEREARAKYKSIYFLRELGVDREENEKLIVEQAKEKLEEGPDGNYISKYEAIDWVAVFVGQGKKEYIPIILKAAPGADAGYAHAVYETIIYELENSPKAFLQYLSEENRKVRKSVYDFVGYSKQMSGEKTFNKILSNAGKLKSDKDVEVIVKEFLSEVQR